MAKASKQQKAKVELTPEEITFLLNCIEDLQNDHDPEESEDGEDIVICHDGMEYKMAMIRGLSQKLDAAESLIGK